MEHISTTVFLLYEIIWYIYCWCESGTNEITKDTYFTEKVSNCCTIITEHNIFITESKIFRDTVLLYSHLYILYMYIPVKL